MHTDVGVDRISVNKLTLTMQMEFCHWDALCSGHHHQRGLASFQNLQSSLSHMTVAKDCVLPDHDEQICETQDKPFLKLSGLQNHSSH